MISGPLWSSPGNEKEYVYEENEDGGELNNEIENENKHENADVNENSDFNAYCTVAEMTILRNAANALMKAPDENIRTSISNKILPILSNTIMKTQFLILAEALNKLHKIHVDSLTY